MGKISAETAILQYMDPAIGPEKRLRIGDRLEIVPRAISLQQRIYGVREQPTRLRIMRGASPLTVSCPNRTVSISGARGGNEP